MQRYHICLLTYVGIYSSLEITYKCYSSVMLKKILILFLKSGLFSLEMWHDIFTGTVTIYNHDIDILQRLGHIAHLNDSCIHECFPWFKSRVWLLKNIIQPFFIFLLLAFLICLIYVFLLRNIYFIQGYLNILNI